MTQLIGLRLVIRDVQTRDVTHIARRNKETHAALVQRVQILLVHDDNRIRPMILREHIVANVIEEVQSVRVRCVAVAGPQTHLVSVHHQILAVAPDFTEAEALRLLREIADFDLSCIEVRGTELPAGRILPLVAEGECIDAALERDIL